MTVIELLAKHAIKLPSTAPGRYYTTCPHCSAGRASKEHRAAKVLGVTIENDESVCFGCNHCDFTGPKKGDGERASSFEATYDYHDKDGALLFQKVRNRPGASSRFLCRRLEGGTWVWGLNKKIQRPLYRLPEILAAIEQGRIVLLVEGEKDADACWRIGLPATCNFDGAAEAGKKSKWRSEYSETLRDTDLVILNDNDGAGYAHAEAACKLSLGVARRVRRLDLAQHWPEIPKSGDVSDWLAAGHTREELDALIEGAPDYAPAEQTKEAQGKEQESSAADAEITRLAKLTPLQYEQERKGAAEWFDIRAGILDKLVAAERARINPDDDNKQGQAIVFPDAEPWPNPLAGAALLDDLANAIRGHVVLPDHMRDAAALWIAHTYLLDHLMVTPRLCVRSPVKGCGKTTLLDVAAQLAFRPLPAANCSASSIFRVVEGHRPTLLIDEADSFLANAEELRGVLNSGHRRGGAVLRNVGDDHEPRSFSTYAACAIALIGQLPGTLADRSVTIDLTRRKRDEAIEPFRFDRVDHLLVLGRKLMRWTKDNAEAIAATEPEMPAGLYNRVADNWRPLLAIATIAGGDWLTRGHRAALQGAGADVDEGSRLELLLGDIRDVFDGLVSDKDRIPSAHLIERLVEIVPRPWAEYGRSGKPLTQNKLARLLKPLGIAPQKVRIGAETPNGYHRHQFQEAWDRFLSAEGGSQPEHRNKCNGMGTSDGFQSGTAKTDVLVQKYEKSNNHGLCSSVPVAKGDQGHRPQGQGDRDTLDRVLGEWKATFGIGVTRTLDHVIEMADEQVNPGLNAAFLAVAAKDDGQSISNILLARWLRDHDADPVGGLCLSYGGVDEAGRPLWTLYCECNETASVPFVLTQEVKHRLRICGYSDDAISHMTPQEAHTILAQAGWSVR
jgi:putative DNA primase/helicase